MTLPCLCQHAYHEGDCPRCKCEVYQADTHLYPVGLVVAS